ncbi:MAG: hypothetical protein GY772_26785 [bacterium]|nr:hypothetical protein [bacterium]
MTSEIGESPRAGAIGGCPVALRSSIRWARSIWVVSGLLDENRVRLIQA